MKSFTLQLETVTPLFLSGANARGAPELRPPAFRGALRYWLRAALAEPDLKKLHEAESAVFGSAANEGDAGPKGQASAVTVRISPGYQLKPPNKVTDLNPNTGYGYLYWALAESGEEENYLGSKQYFQPGTQFKLTLTARSSNNEKSLKQAATAAWLLIRLGGVGACSRRLAGNLQVLQEPTGSYDGPKILSSASSLGEVVKELKAGLHGIWEIMEKRNSDPQPMPEYDALLPNHFRVWVLGEWSTVRAAQDALGRALKEARKNIALDQRALFGLPAQNIVLTAKPNRQTKIDRRASPLWLTVAPLRNSERCVVVATLFKSRFLPNGTQLDLSSKVMVQRQTTRQTMTQPAPINYAPIETWLSGFSNSQEVTYGD